MTTEEIVELCDNRAHDWFTIAPKYRTEARLSREMLDLSREILLGEIADRQKEKTP